MIEAMLFILIVVNIFIGLKVFCVEQQISMIEKVVYDRDGQYSHDAEWSVPFERLVGGHAK